MNKMISTIVISLAISILGTEAVENSIIPQVEKFEKIENLMPQKYAQSQYGEISSLLKRKEEYIRIVTYNMLFNLYDHNTVDGHFPSDHLPVLIDCLIKE